MRLDPPITPPSLHPNVRRAQLTADVEAFLAKGGQIEKVQQGESTKSEFARKILGLQSYNSAPVKKKSSKKKPTGYDDARRFKQTTV